MESSAYRSLAFLFSLGTLPLACNPKGGGNTDDTDGTTDPTGGTTGPTDGTTDGNSSATTTTTGEPTTGPTTSTGETAGAEMACAGYVAYSLKCSPESMSTEAELYAYCAMTRTRVAAIFGPTCLALQDALYDCLGASPCEQADLCADEFAAVGQCYPEPSAGCVAFAAKQEECYGMPLPAYAGMCQYGVNIYSYYMGPPCGSALEEWYACLVDLPCPEFEMQTGCDDLRAAVDLACEGA